MVCAKLGAAFNPAEETFLMNSIYDRPSTSPQIDFSRLHGVRTADRRRGGAAQACGASRAKSAAAPAARARRGVEAVRVRSHPPGAAPDQASGHEGRDECAGRKTGSPIGKRNRRRMARRPRRAARRARARTNGRWRSRARPKAQQPGAACHRGRDRRGRQPQRAQANEPPCLQPARAAVCGEPRVRAPAGANRRRRGCASRRESPAPSRPPLRARRARARHMWAGRADDESERRDRAHARPRPRADANRPPAVWAGPGMRAARAPIGAAVP